ncbi:hypothetical protein B0A48_04787 [Cryoendolithus antarcticus]|uniref:Uncharacterized protein n=1 Tax=Cryoendolithus antarcticus TaxID=1507870 RepID=A0A1V8TDC1_9PEZI|nr:hypothetical protein B0A48_04787 [Cryoendolithus antarcticus]
MDAYQAHSARRVEAPQQTTRVIEPQYIDPTSEPKQNHEQTLAEAFRGLELERKGIPPPTYEEVTINRAVHPGPAAPAPMPRSFDRHFDALDDFDSDSEAEFERGMRGGGVVRGGDSWVSAKREWRARKAARREEKRRVKCELKAVLREGRMAWREERRGRREERRGRRCC